MTKSIFFLLLLLIFSQVFHSCSDENMHFNSVKFNNLKVGDVMLYSFVKGKDHPTQSSDATYTGDTLKLTVTDEIDGKFVIEEQITSHSAIFDSDNNYLFTEFEKTYKLLWDISEDSILISSLESANTFKSHIFLRAHRMPMTVETDISVKFDGCRTTLPHNDHLANFIIEDDELLDISYTRLNGILNYTHMVLDGDGFTNIYNREDGFVRVTTTSGWTSDVWGWDRIGTSN